MDQRRGFAPVSATSEHHVCLGQRCAEIPDGVPHPRGYGNNARVLARYVRELNFLRLEDAVRRMTSLPATTFRLKDRGVIRQGAWADLVILDPTKVQDTATFQEPHQYAAGFAWVS
jgi:N-acyl-D-amino-acid deacylase